MQMEKPWLPIHPLTAPSDQVSDGASDGVSDRYNVFVFSTLGCVVAVL